MAAGYLCALVAGASLTFGSAGVLTQDEPNIVEVAAGNDNFETLVAALIAADLVDDIQGASGITVLAPTDAAFAKLDQDALNATIQQSPTTRLADILKFHVIPEVLTAAQLAERRFVTTLDGQRLDIGTSEGVTLNGSRIRSADIRASNGIVHAIDTVLIPAKQNIAEVAESAGTFKTLLAAAEAAGLVDALIGPGPITIFAPTDEAFAKLGTETIRSLLLPENRDTLAGILSYHAIVDERIYSEGLLESGPLATASGDAISPSVRDGSVLINSSRVVRANIDASNGVIHVIDAVLLPKAPARASAQSSPNMVGSFESVLTLAIERGVPLFNDHQPGACAAVYEVAIASVLALTSDLDGAQRDDLSQALSSGRNEKNDTERAWIYRRGIDRVLAQTKSDAMMTSDSGSDSPRVIDVSIDRRGGH